MQDRPAVRPTCEGCSAPLSSQRGSGAAAIPDVCTGLWSAGNEGKEKSMEIIVMGYRGTTIRIHYFVPS